MIRVCYSWSLLLDGLASPVERPLVCVRLGKFVLPRPLWTRASENSFLLSGGLGEEKGILGNPALCELVNGDVASFVGVNFGNKFLCLLLYLFLLVHTSSC